MKYNIERDARAFDMRCSGETWRSVGAAVGVSPTRAQQMANRHYRYLKHRLSLFDGSDGRCGYSSYEMLNPQLEDFT